MKKYVFAIMALFAFTFSSCHKDSILPDPTNMDYETFTDQFKTIWNGINTGYAFWDLDPLDWDAVYEQYLPVFQSFDEQNSISNRELENAYKGMCGKLMDHHFYMKVRNLKPTEEDFLKYITVNPGKDEVENRDYYHVNNISTGIIANLQNLESQGVVNEMDIASKFNINIFNTENYVFALIGGNIAYLHLDCFDLSENLKSNLSAENDNVDTNIVRVYEKWRDVIKTAPNVKGIILDVRGNGGGNADDFKYVIAPFIVQPFGFAYTRTKFGTGRYDFLPEQQYVIEPANDSVDTSHLPFVILTDVNSASMSEVTALAVQSMPNGYVIGERTFGAFGPLTTVSQDLFYSGTIGEVNENHYIYMPFQQMRDMNGECLEGIGIIPDEEVLFNERASEFYDGTYDNQLMHAIRYIENK